MKKIAALLVILSILPLYAIMSSSGEGELKLPWGITFDSTVEDVRTYLHEEYGLEIIKSEEEDAQYNKYYAIVDMPFAGVNFDRVYFKFRCSDQEAAEDARLIQMMLELSSVSTSIVYDEGISFFSAVRQDFGEPSSLTLSYTRDADTNTAIETQKIEVPVDSLTRSLLIQTGREWKNMVIASTHGALEICAAFLLAMETSDDEMLTVPYDALVFYGFQVIFNSDKAV